MYPRESSMSLNRQSALYAGQRETARAPAPTEAKASHRKSLKQELMGAAQI